MDIDALKNADKDLSEGDWVRDIPGLEGVGFKVRSYSSPRVQRALGRAYRIAEITSEEDDTEAQDRAVMVSDVLIDWEGFTQKGEEVKYNPEIAAEWVHIDLLFAGMRYAALQVTRKQSAALERLAKNSQKPSEQKSQAA